MIFQGRGRPQGNGDKTDLRLFPKKYDFSRSGALQVLKIWPPDQILEHFLYHSELFWPVCLTGSLGIVRKSWN